MAPKDWLSSLQFGAPQKAASTEAALPEKAQNVEMSAAAKMALWGSPAQQDVIATARRNGNLLADEDVQNLWTMSEGELFDRYGPSIVGQLGNLADADQRISRLENLERSDAEIARDSAIGIGIGGAATLAGIGALGAEAVDFAAELPGRVASDFTGRDLNYDVPSAGPAISRWSQQMRQWGQGAQSDILKARQEHLAIEQELDKADRQTRFEEARAAGQASDTAWIRKQGQALWDTVTNYADDPMAASAVAAEGVGSLLTGTAAIRAVGKARAMQKLRKSGLDPNSAEGKALINREMMQAVPLVTSVMEGGGGVTQAQSEILSMDEETLNQSEEYRALRNENLSHEEAQRRLASDAGKAAGLVGTILGYGTGQISRAFEVNPFGIRGSGRPGSAALGAAGIVALETAEEGIQEGANQISANIGVQNAGIERDTTEGLGVAVGEGMVGGFGMAGITSAPGATVETASEILSAVAGGSKKAWDARLKSVDANLRQNGATGLRELARASLDITEIAREMTAPVSPTRPEGATDPGTEQTSSLDPETKAMISDAAFLSEDETKVVADIGPLGEELKQTGNISRTTQIAVFSEMVADENAPEDLKNAFSIAMIESYDKMRRLVSDDLETRIGALEEGDENRTKYERLKDGLKTVESNGSLNLAKQNVEALTSETLRGLMAEGLADIDAGKLDTKAARDTMQTLEVVGRYNPMAVDVKDYDRVLEQISPENESLQKLRETLQTVRDIAASIQENQIERERLEREKAWTEKGQVNATEKTTSAVRKEIMTGIFKSRRSGNDHLGLTHHYAEIVEAGESGSAKMFLAKLTQLGNFAQSQNNKIGAYNESAREGKGNRKSFEAYDGSQFYDETAMAFMPYIQLKSKNSVFMAQGVQADTETIVRLHNMLLEHYGTELGLTENQVDERMMKAAQLDPIIRFRGRQELSEADQRRARQQKQIQARMNAPLRKPNQKGPGGMFEAQTGELDLDNPNTLPDWNLSDEDRLLADHKVLTKKEIAALEKKAGGKQPMIQLLRGMGGIKVGGTLYRRLRARGMTAKDAPGLFRKKTGIGSADQIVASEYDGFAELIGDDGQGYADTDAVADAVLDEIAGTPRPYLFEQEQAAEELAQRLALDEYVGRLQSERTTPSQPTPEQTTEAPQQSSPEATAEPQAEPEAEGDIEVSEVIEPFEEDPDADGQAGAEAQASPRTESVDETDRVESPAEDSAEDREGSAEDAGATDTGATRAEPGDRPAREDADRQGESEPEAEPVGPKSLEEAFPDLAGTEQGQNYFLKAFRLVKGASTFLAQDKPYEHALAALSGVADTRLLRSFRDDMEDMRQRMNARLSEAINVKRGGKRDKTQIPKSLLERIDPEGNTEPENIYRHKNTRPYNLSRIDQDAGTVEMDPRIFEAGMMAAMQWMLQAEAKGQPRLDNKRLKEMFKLPDESAVTKHHWQLALKGFHLQSAIDEIARQMEQLLGVQQRNDVSTSFTQGMFRGAADEMLAILDETNWITLNVDKAVDSYKVGNETRSHFTVTLAQDPTARDFRKAYSDRLDLFSGVFLSQFEKTRYVGEAPKSKPKSILGQRGNKLSRVQNEVVQKLQKTEHRLVGPMVGLAEALSPETFVRLLGYQNTSEGVWNVAHKESVDGKNKSLVKGLEATLGYVNEARAKADELGVTEFEVPIFFDWEISSVGRLQQQGPVTPQGDKIAREMVSATMSTLDLSDPDQSTALMLAMAQSLDISVEKAAHADTVRDVTALLEGQYKPAVDAMREFLREGTVDPGIVDVFKQAKIDQTAKAVHAIVTAAQLAEAQESDPESLKSFQTSLALEFDGKTDGPINAMLNMGSGSFTPEQVSVMAKGGLYIGSDVPISLNDYVAGNADKGLRNGDGLDLYHVAAAKFEQKMREAIRNQGPKEAADTVQVLKLLSFFLGPKMFAYDVEKGTLSVGRNMVKNPLTVFIYGSSEKGIAGKVAGEVLGEIHKMLSELATSAKRGEIKRISEHPRFQGPNSEILPLLVDMFPGIKDVLSNPTEKTMEGYAESLTNVINETIGDALTEALDEATGGLRKNMQTIQTVSQIQALYFVDTYKSLIQKKLAEKDYDGDILSQKDLREVFEEASRIAPVYTSDVQEFHVATAEGYSSDQRVSESVMGNLSSGSTIPMPSDPGVRVSPFLIIGTGDGMMMMNIYTGEAKQMENTLPVFDGVEGNLLGIKDAARHINKSVWQGWKTEDVAGMVAQSFAQTLRMKDDSVLSQKTRSEIAGKLKTLSKRGVPVQSLEELYNTTRRLAAQNKARKRAMNRMALSVDHMAGADAPYTKSGETVPMEGYDAVEVSHRLNALYAEELDKLRAEEREKRQRPAVQKPTKEVQEVLDLVAEDTGIAGTKQISGEKLSELVRTSNGFDAEQVNLFENVLSSGALDGYSFFFGSSEALDTLKATSYRGLDQKPVQNGQLFSGSRVAFIANASPETVMHEILHAYTGRRLIDYYADVSDGLRVPKYVSDAVQRLEKLMADVRRMDFSGNTPVDKAGRTLLQDLEAKKADPAVQMGEFISWMLTNQNLIGLGKETQVRSSLARVADRVLGLLKRILGIKGPRPGKDLFSNIRFNAEVLARVPDGEILAQQEESTQAIFEQVFGEDTDLDALEQTYMQRLEALLERKVKTPNARATEKAHLLRDGFEAAETARQFGWQMNAREVEAFRAIHAVMSIGTGLNSGALKQANRIFSAALDQAPDTAQWQFLSGAKGLRYQKDGTRSRSDLMPTFMALGLINPDLKAQLAEMPAPKMERAKENPEDGQIDTWLNRIARAVIGTLEKLSLSNRSIGTNAQEQIEVLAGVLSEVRRDRRLKAEALGFNVGDKLNGYLSGMMAQGSEKTVEYLQKRRKKITDPRGIGKYRAVGLEAASLVASLGSKEAFSARAGALQESFNRLQGYNEIRALWNDMVGGMDDSEIAGNFGLMRLMKQVRAKIDAMRQDFREQIPHELAQKFSRKLTSEEWTELQRSIAYIDLTALGRDETLDLMKDPSSLAQRIQSAEAEVTRLGGPKAQRFQTKAQVLGGYLATKEVRSDNLIPNAYAIAKLAGEHDRLKAEPAEDLVQAIDRLVSLYAYQELSQETRDRMAELMETEAEGMRYVVGYHELTRLAEIERVNQTAAPSMARMNGWKGYAPSIVRDGHDLIVADDAEQAKLEMKGYVRVGTYQGDALENYRGRRGYYRSTVGGKAAYRQGTAQTVHETWKGVDPRTGFSDTAMMGGTIRGAMAQRLARKRGRAKDNLNQTEALLPVFDPDGQIVGYERSLDPEQISQLQIDEHMGRMLGVWTGRQLEEKLANEFNARLIKELKRVYDYDMRRGPKGKGDQYINLATEDDPVMQDAWDTLGDGIKEQAAQIFGQPDFLPIRRDMALDAVGMRAFSLREAWDEDDKSRAPKKLRQALRETATVFMGAKGYRNVVWAETQIQDLVSYAKTTIVVRGLQVIWENMVSNQLHLMTHGIGPIEGLRGIKDKFLEANTYMSNREEITRLNLELAAKGRNAKERERISAKIQSLEDANRQLSIAPLLEAGELSTISEDLTEADTAVREGKISDYLEKAADALPGLVGDAAKTVMITKDSALFKGLNRAVQYGDFTAKAVLYDHLTQRKGMSKEEALRVISEEFVNYDRLAGRGREYLESMGLIWFMNYKIRIMKVMGRMMRDRPATALLYAGGVGPMAGIDTVISGSLPGAWLDGRLGYAVGPEMGLNAWQLHPFYGMFS